MVFSALISGGNYSPVKFVRVLIVIFLLFVSFVAIQEFKINCVDAKLTKQFKNGSIVSIGKHISGKYKRTHGKNVDSIYAPYVEEYAEVNGININKIAVALFPKAISKPDDSKRSTIFISSYKHINRINGSWTYFKSASVMFYEILKIGFDSSLDPMIMVLYSRLIPTQIIIDKFDAKWCLAVLNEKYRVLANCPFETHIKYREEGVWDMIYTDLAAEKGIPIVKIMYAHTGGGGSRSQEFTFWFELKDKPISLKLKEAKQTLDEHYIDDYESFEQE